jgi:hypothetical protein
MVYVTQFRKKRIVVKNNVKNKMIQSLTCFLTNAIEELQTSVVPAECVHSQITLPQYDKSSIDPYTKADESAMPCLVRNCEWIEYQDIVTNNPSKPMWRLPAITPDGKCILCKLNDEKKLDISKIRMAASNQIIII